MRIIDYVEIMLLVVCSVAILTICYLLWRDEHKKGRF